MSRDSLRRVIRTFIQAFLGLLLPGLLGFLNEVTKWAADQGQRPFPDATNLSYLLVSAAGAACIAVVTLIMVGIEDAAGKGLLRDIPARPPAGDAGAVVISWPWLIVIAAAIIVVAVAVF